MYADFDVRIEAAGRRYRIRAVSSAGEAVHETSRPLVSRDRLKAFLFEIGRPREDLRRIDSPQMDSIRAFGGQLFKRVFQGDVLTRLASSIDDARQHGLGLRIRLRLSPELADLPWEYLYDGRQFLGLSTSTPIVRYLEMPQIIEPLSVAPPLRIMVAAAGPKGFPRLDVEQECERLEAALQPLIERGSVTIERLRPATADELHRKLRLGTYHVFHFIGHGTYDTARDDGVLLLEDEYGQGWRMAGEELGILLHDHQSLRLAILNSCEGARGSVRDPFSGAAQSLVAAGVPAVIAMQFEITDQAAIRIAQAFYGAVADGFPVDAALADARKAVRLSGNEVEWATPVLYMRAPDGRIFDIVLEDAGQAAVDAAERQLRVDALEDKALPQLQYEEALQTQGALRRVNSMARSYEQLRDAMEPGSERSAAMEDLWRESRDLIRNLDVGHGDVRRLITSPAEGDRLMGLVAMEAHPRLLDFDLLGGVLVEPISPFEQVHALDLANQMISVLDSQQRSRLEGLIREQRDSGRIKPGMDRWRASEEVLATLQSAAADRARRESVSETDLTMTRGKVLNGRYRIESLLGQGQLSAVYHATDLRLERSVALKILMPALAQDDAFRQRFVRESTMAARFDHPNILPVYEVGEFNDLPGVLLLVMKYVDGTSLGTLITREGPLDRQLVISIISQVAGALDSTHVRGLVHRGVSPSSILVAAWRTGTDEPRVFLSGFGLAVVASQAKGLTMAGRVIGTPDYLAPEQIKAEPVDGRTDVYSLGCVAHLCLTGEQPFVGEDLAVLYAHVADSPPAVTGKRPDLPIAVDSVLARAMAKSPDDRFPTCGEFAAGLRDALRSM